MEEKEKLMEEQEELEEQEEQEAQEPMKLTLFRQDSPSPVFIRFPRFLLEMDLSPMAMVLYALLMDRAELSRRNGWVEEDGRVYQNFTQESLMKVLRKKRTTIHYTMKELEEAGLIVKRRQGVCRPNKLYVKIPVNTCSKKRTYDVQDIEQMMFKKLNTNKNNRIRTLNKKSEEVFDFDYSAIEEDIY